MHAMCCIIQLSYINVDAQCDKLAMVVGQPVTLPAVSEHWRKQEALIPTEEN